MTKRKLGEIERQTTFPSGRAYELFNIHRRITQDRWKNKKGEREETMTVKLRIPARVVVRLISTSTKDRCVIHAISGGGKKEKGGTFVGDRGGERWRPVTTSETISRSRSKTRSRTIRLLRNSTYTARTGSECNVIVSIENSINGEFKLQFPRGDPITKRSDSTL